MTATVSLQDARYATSDAVDHVVAELRWIHPLPPVQLVGRQADAGLIRAQAAAVEHEEDLVALAVVRRAAGIAS